jgi:hypothetical protein
VTQIKVREALPCHLVVVEDELHKLLRDLGRYRALLSLNADARADKVIRELIVEAEDRIRELKGRGIPA